MGQNIGTCVTALISSVGTNKMPVVRQWFTFTSILSVQCILTLFTVLDSLFNFAFLDWPSNHFFIAVVHSLFNILCTAMLLPFSGLLEKLAYKTIKEDDKKDKVSLLDPRLFSTPAIANQPQQGDCREMAYASVDAIKKQLLW